MSAESTKATSLMTYISREELSQFTRVHGGLGALGLLWVWGGIAAGMGLVYLSSNPLVWLLAVVWIGNRQFALAIMMHEGAHFLLARDRGINDFMSQWLAAYPVMSNTMPYRPYHNQHHAHAETEQDPDKVLSRPFPVTRTSFTRKILRDITGIAGARRYYGSLKSVYKSTKGPLWHRLATTVWKLRGFVITNSIVLAATWVVFGSPLAYLLLWWVPMLTYYSLIYRIRNIAEHACVPNTSIFDNTRTTLSPPWMSWVIAPLDVNYHLEHHLCPRVPWYRLRAFHLLLRKRIEGKEQPCYASGYWQVLSQASSGKASARA